MTVKEWFLQNWWKIGLALVILIGIPALVYFFVVKRWLENEE